MVREYESLGIDFQNCMEIIEHRVIPECVCLAYRVIIITGEIPGIKNLGADITTILMGVILLGISGNMLMESKSNRIV
jgi:hypothetical protein